MGIRLPAKREFLQDMMELLMNIKKKLDVYPINAIINDNSYAHIVKAIEELDLMLGLETSTPLVYVAGQYYPSTKLHGESSGLRHWEITQNIYRAREAGAEAVKKGWAPIIPHTNTAWMSGLQPHHWWYIATLEQLRVCDAIIMVEGWQNSTGATEELEEAKRMGINIYMNSKELPIGFMGTCDKET